MSKRQSMFETSPELLHVSSTPNGRRYSVASGNSQAFYSPVHTPTDTVECDLGCASNLNVLNAEDLALVRQGKEVLLKSLEVVFSEGWVKESKSNNKDIIESKIVEGVKVFRMQALLDATAEHVMTVLYDDIDTHSTWNSGLMQSRVLKTVDTHTDIGYTVSVAKGPIKSRDFVFLRHRAAVGTSLVIASTSIEHIVMPPNKTYIRGENGAGCFVITPLLDDVKKCDLLWLVNTNLKGWLPKTIVDVAFTSFIQSFVTDLRGVLATQSKGQESSGLSKTLPCVSISDLPLSVKEHEMAKSLIEIHKRA